MVFLSNLELFFGLVPLFFLPGLFIGVIILAFGRRYLAELPPAHRMRFWIGLIASCVIAVILLSASAIYWVFEVSGFG
jgi:hypothetical protein